MTIRATLDDTTKRDALLMAWDASKKALDHYKEEEMTLRKAITALCFEGVEKGTHRVPLNAGFNLKLSCGLTYTLDKNNLGKTLDALDEVSGNQNASAAVVRWVPELVEREYLLLPKEFRIILDEVVTSKPASPKLTIEAPKGQK